MDGVHERHPPDTYLERYCLGTITDWAELKALEIHLAKCAWCERRIAETCVYVNAVQVAFRVLEDDMLKPRRPAVVRVDPEELALARRALEHLDACMISRQREETGLRALLGKLRKMSSLRHYES